MEEDLVGKNARFGTPSNAANAHAEYDRVITLLTWPKHFTPPGEEVWSVIQATSASRSDSLKEIFCTGHTAPRGRLMGVGEPCGLGVPWGIRYNWRGIVICPL